MKRHTLAALVAASLLAACGGGGNSGETKLTPVGLKVVGASLADSGTFGLKFTVQSASGTPYAVYTERLLAEAGFADSVVRRDLAGLDRVVEGRKP